MIKITRGLDFTDTWVRPEQAIESARRVRSVAPFKETDYVGNETYDDRFGWRQSEARTSTV